ncbi:MAG: carboxypeptidase-like regulatory domain-containing protein [bacterium]
MTRARRPWPAERAGGLALWALVALVACQSDPVALPAADAGGDARFVDLAGLPDGVVIREDARVEPPDAARLDDAGRLCRTGSTTGIVCAPDGTPIGEARVVATSRDCDGRAEVFETRADGDGHFRFPALAPGPATITVESGSFLGTFEVEIIAGVNVPAGGGISDKICLESRAARLAVLTGDFDRIQLILGSLGFEHDLYCGDGINSRGGRALLADPAALGAYDIVFVNCASGIDFRATNPEVQATIEHLRRFVAEGGSVYASDLAGDLVQQAWPGFVELGLRARPAAEADACCVCGDCPPACVADPPRPPRACQGCCPDANTQPEDCPRGGGVAGSGMAGTVAGRLEALFLATALGADAVDVIFNLGAGCPSCATIRGCRSWCGRRTGGR